MQFRKKILGGIAAILVASTLTMFASAISASDFTYNTTVKTYQMYRSYTAITEYKYSSPLDVITAGVSCCRIDTGANVGDGWLTENKNSRKATASEAISYNPYSMSVRGFGSHSAYENGQTVLYKFTQSSAA